MGIRSPIHPKAGGLFLLVLGLLLLGAYTNDQAALAHGKELRIRVSSFVPDTGEPLNRLYRVEVVYAYDEDPVVGAKVSFVASRLGGGPPMGPLRLEPLNEPGLYVAEIDYPLYGSWNVTLSVAGAGEGETSFVEEVVPAGPARDADEVRREALQLFFSFDWRDVAAIAVRVAHSLAAVVWFSLTGVILVAHWFLPPAARPAVYRRLAGIFLPGTVISLGLLIASGIYSGIYSAPVKAPGIFDFDVMWRIPFGTAYLATIAYKTLALGACVVLAVSIARVLRTASYPVVAGADDSVAIKTIAAPATKTAPLGNDRRLYRLAAANALLGGSLAVAVAVAIYLHYISHLAIFLPD